MTRHRQADMYRTVWCDDLTPEMVELARRRTLPMLHNWHLIDLDVHRLARCCYLQGARDMAEVLARERLGEDAGEYQI